MSDIQLGTISNENKQEDKAIKYFKYDINQSKSQDIVGTKTGANYLMRASCLGNGLERIQESGYITQTPVTAGDALSLSIMITAALPHSFEMFNSLQVTDLTNHHTLMENGQFIESKRKLDKNAEDKQFYAITYDFDTVGLKKDGGKNLAVLAYADFKKHLVKNGYEKTQFSAFVSKDKTTFSEVEKMVKDFCEEHPEYEKNVKKMDVSVMGKNFDLMPYLQNYMMENEKAHNMMLENLLTSCSVEMDGTVTCCRKEEDKYMKYYLESGNRIVAGDFYPQINLLAFQLRNGWDVTFESKEISKEEFKSQYDKGLEVYEKVVKKEDNVDFTMSSVLAKEFYNEAMSVLNEKINKEAMLHLVDTREIGSLNWDGNFLNLMSCVKDKERKITIPTNLIGAEFIAGDDYSEAMSTPKIFWAKLAEATNGKNTATCRYVKKMDRLTIDQNIDILVNYADKLFEERNVPTQILTVQDPKTKEIGFLLITAGKQFKDGKFMPIDRDHVYVDENHNIIPKVRSYLIEDGYSKKLVTDKKGKPVMGESYYKVLTDTHGNPVFKDKDNTKAVAVNIGKYKFNEFGEIEKRNSTKFTLINGYSTMHDYRLQEERIVAEYNEYLKNNHIKNDKGNDIIAVSRFDKSKFANTFLELIERNEHANARTHYGYFKEKHHVKKLEEALADIRSHSGR